MKKTVLVFCRSHANMTWPVALREGILPLCPTYRAASSAGVRDQKNVELMERVQKKPEVRWPRSAPSDVSSLFRAFQSMLAQQRVVNPQDPQRLGNEEMEPALRRRSWGSWGMRCSACPSRVCWHPEPPVCWADPPALAAGEGGSCPSALFR